MKRSKTIRLVAMATTAVAFASLAGCSDDEPDIRMQGTSYKNVSDCIEQNTHITDPAEKLSNEQCEAVIAEAQKLHEETAPRYDSRDLCAEQHGIASCYASSGPQPYYMPYPTGYFFANHLAASLAAHAIADSVRPYYPAHDERGGYSSYRTTSGSPIVYNSTQGWSTPAKKVPSVSSSGNGKKPTSITTFKTKPAPAKVQTRTSVASRGGFGGSSSSRSSFGFSRGG